MKRALTIAVGLAILAFIYGKIDFRQVLGLLSSADPAWMALALAAFIPLIWIAAVRLCWLAPQDVPMALPEALRLNLAAAALNMVLPSKMGDLAKSWFFRQRGHLSGSMALALVVFERLCDMLALLVWCAFGLVFVPGKDPALLLLTVCVFGSIAAGLLVLGVPRVADVAFDLAGRFAPASIREKGETLRSDWRAMHAYFWGSKRRLGGIAVFSVSIWFSNLVQVWLFVRALGANAPLPDTLGLAPLAILIGLLPLTFAGVGTRDAAVIYLFRGYLTVETAAAIGMLLTFRYMVLGVAGLPFVKSVSERSSGPQTPGSRT